MRWISTNATFSLTERTPSRQDGGEHGRDGGARERRDGGRARAGGRVAALVREGLHDRRDERRARAGRHGAVRHGRDVRDGRVGRRRALRVVGLARAAEHDDGQLARLAAAADRKVVALQRRRADAELHDAGGGARAARGADGPGEVRRGLGLGAEGGGPLRRRRRRHAREEHGELADRQRHGCARDEAAAAAGGGRWAVGEGGWGVG